MVEGSAENGSKEGLGAESDGSTFSAESLEQPVAEIPEDEAAFFRSLGGRLGLSEAETFILGNKLSYQRKGFLADLKAEQEHVAERLGLNVMSRADLKAYQAEIDTWQANEERSPNRESKIHGSAHFMRVLINTQTLSGLVEAQLPARLSDLSVKPPPPELDYDVRAIDRRALAVFAVGHDWARIDDETNDPEHGARAAQSLQNPSIFPTLPRGSRVLAQRLMSGHSYDDQDGALEFEHCIARDADLLDRHRDNKGPDPSYIRLKATREIDAVAYALAVISDSLIEKGDDQVEAVVKTAHALGLLRD